ncbi:hypothetical protein [Agaricicola taiwanensis]|nr:hypothetical protein [Agaricicola taiwanensis]
MKRLIMLTRLMTAAALLGASATLALAQPRPDHDGPRHFGQRGDGPPHHMRHGRGDRDMDHDRDDRESGKGFALRLGPGIGLRIRCGDEPVKACVDAAVPLIDRMAEVAKGTTSSPPPPPPRHSRPLPPPHGERASPPPPPGRADDMPAPPLPSGETVPPQPSGDAASPTPDDGGQVLPRPPAN